MFYNLKTNPDLKKALLTNVLTTKVYEINEIDTRAEFFTSNFKECKSICDRDKLNELTYERLLKDTGIGFGFAFNSDHHFVDECLDPLYIPISYENYNKTLDVIPQVFLKVDLYTEDMSIIMASVNYETNEIDPEEYYKEKCQGSFDDICIDYKRARGSAEGLDEYIRERAKEEFESDSSFAHGCGFEYVYPTEVSTTEFLLDEEMKQAYVANISKNDPVEFFDKSSITTADFFNQLREKAIKYLERDSVKRSAEKRNINAGALIENLRKKSETMKKDQNFYVERKGNEYVIHGVISGSIGDVCQKIEELKTAIENDARTPDLVLDLDNNGIKIAILHHKTGNGFFEIGLSLPDDFSHLDNIDEEKIYTELGLKGIPVFATKEAVGNYGCLKGHPAIFVATNSFNEETAICFAYDNARALKSYDFEQYKELYGNFNAFCKDEALTSAYENSAVEEFEDAEIKN